MAIPLIIMALITMAAVINDKLGDLGTLVKSDLFGDKSQAGFVAWVGAIIVVASFFKMLDLPQAGRGIIILIILAYVLGNRDIPGQITNALQGASREGGAPAPSAPAPGSPAALLPGLAGGASK